MGKTFVYIVLLGILGFGVYFFIIKDKEGLYSEAEANFTLRDTSEIGKIFLVQNDGESILVERNETNNWVVNKKFPAMPIQIINILTCLRKQTALSPVTEKEHDRVVKLLAGMGTKVEIYNRKGKKIRSFFIAGQGPNFHGSYMILEKAAQPYLVEIPGFEGYLTPVFSTDLNEWRSRAVFNVGPENIASISVQYPDEPLNSYELKNTGKSPVVVLDPSIQASFTELNRTRVNAYLKYFTAINAEGFLNGTMGIDTVLAKAKFRCTIAVTSKDGTATALDIFWKNLTDHGKDLRDQTSTDPENRPTDVERLYAVNKATHDTLLIQALSFEKLFRYGYEFYEKDGNNQAPKTKPTPLNQKKAPINYVK